jgi:hypothetical protein
MARLIYVPVVHSTAEMGSAAPAYKAAFVARHGEGKWAERSAKFDVIWRAIADAIKALWLDLRRVKLYQDSLPVSGQEVALVQDLAALGSQNHQLLVGTESPELLLEEYRLLQSPEERTEAIAADLLEARDRFIAGRIDTTLGDGEDGILFIGALHKVAKFLPQRIRVEYLAIRGQ